jgi:rubrerythrin
MPKQKNWTENPKVKFVCEKCGTSWKQEDSVTCPKCDGINKAI